MPVRTRRLVAALGASAVLAALAPAIGGAFTGTPAAVKLISMIRAVYSRMPAASWVLTGDIVYCLDYPEGWTYAPHAGCQIPARVTEDDQLSTGHVVRAVGVVTAPSQPTLRYVISPHGWYLAAVGAKCWASFRLPYVSPLYISYPFPGQRVSILSATKSEIVIQALTPRFGLRELDYVDAKTLLEPRTVTFAVTKQKTYSYTYTSLPAKAPPSLATPACAGNAG
jgi:hypothetical protein